MRSVAFSMVVLVAVLLFLLLVAEPVQPPHFPHPEPRSHVLRLVLAESLRQDVPAELLSAVIAAESSWKPDAYRYEAHLDDASYGLMQVLYSTAQDMGYTGPPDGLFDPATNIRYGTKYLRWLMDRFDDLWVVVAAYNAGPGRVGKLIAKHGNSYEDIQPYLPEVTRAYVERVRSYMNREE